MVDDKKMSAVLSEFARTLVADFPIQGLLDHLVERVIEVLPITSAGVTLISPGVEPRYIAASDAAALRFEGLQTQLGEGPCLTAYQTGEAVAVPELAKDDRYPRFAPLALAAGLAAAFTFPLRQGDKRLGALDLYRDTAGAISADDMAAAQTLADVAAAHLSNVQARTDARAVSEHFRRTASHDALTGLPNRLLLAQRMEHASKRGRRTHSAAAVLFADLDGFKLVNDFHGHQLGDEVLVAVAHRLSSLLRPGDTLARVSGDEFVILCEDLQDTFYVGTLAARIDRAFTAPFRARNVDIAITASVGIAFAGPGEELTEQLINDADTAMYQRKRKGGAGHQIIDLRQANNDSRRRALEQDLRAALTEQQIDMHYQPVVRSADGLLTGVEALLRWTHPTYGPIAPQKVVAMAERIGLIGELGAWALERACREHQQWLAHGASQALEVAVNVSTVQLMAPGFASMVAKMLQETGIQPSSLILEMTEDIFIEDAERARSVLLDLKLQGVQVALDDFGTGYSSLSYLRSFPVDVLKIDQAFLDDVGYDPVGSAILSAVTNLAHVLKIKVTAEGVETRRQRDEVTAVGCESSQGFYYGHPMAADQIAQLLQCQRHQPIHLPVEVRAGA
jgi:diguanylate cyclase (GGDEF)-like protein